jgi:hypothetical protein
MAGMVDDRILQAAALDLLKQAKRERPTIRLAAHLIDNSPGAAFVVEVRIPKEGPISSMIVLDHAASTEQQIL